MKLLQSRDLKMIKEEHLLSFLKDSRIIEEAFFLERESRIYVTSILRPERVKVKSISLKDAAIAHESCLKLIMEAVKLIQGLQEIGLTLREPL